MADYKPAREVKNKAVLDNPPLIVDVLAKILGLHLKKHRMPECMPNQHYDACHWFVSHQEPAHEYRDRVEPIEKEGSIVGWRTPYHDRLSSNLKIFLSMSELQQVYIAANVEAGIPWRGDSILMYSKIIEQHKAMMKNTEAYIGNAKEVLKQMMRV